MDEKYMDIALSLAEKGNGNVNPNPMVGAIIVKNGEIIAKGYHEKFGENHAEINAFNSAKEDVKDATMYVTLEPCSHYGKTPPCVDKIIEKKIKKVVIGMADPNPIVAGRGIEKLKQNGIEVVTGILEDKCKKLNEVFIKYITFKKPFVIMKAAMSLDGKISTKTGESKWITCEESRKKVHKLRNEVSAIMVGVDTVIKDNPSLTCRINKGKNPIRIIVDSNLRIPENSNVINSANYINTIIACTENLNKEKATRLKEKGVEILITKSKNKRVDLDDLMCKIGEKNIDSLLLEGGGTLNFSALDENIVDKIQIYIAPKIIGGKDSKTPVEGKGIEVLKDAFRLENLNMSFVDEDIFIEGYVKRGE